MEPLTPQQAQQIRLQAQSIDATAKTPIAQQMLTFWREHRPNMTARLTELGILEDFAIVQEERYDQDLVRLIQEESMSQSEAAMIAGDHLLMTAEADEPEVQETVEQETKAHFQPVSIDPELMAKTVKMAHVNAKAGITTVEAYAEAIAKNFGDAYAREFARCMEAGWWALHTTSVVNDPASKVDDFLGKELTRQTLRPAVKRLRLLSRHATLAIWALLIASFSFGGGWLLYQPTRENDRWWEKYPVSGNMSTMARTVDASEVPKSFGISSSEHLVAAIIIATPFALAVICAHFWHWVRPTIPYRVRIGVDSLALACAWGLMIWLFASLLAGEVLPVVILPAIAFALAYARWSHRLEFRTPFL